MAVDAARAKSIFLAASELPNLAERADYLVQQCGSDGPLRARVEALLRAHDAAADLGDEPSGPGYDPTIIQPVSENPGIDHRRPLQTAGSDRRRGDGFGLGRRAIPASQTQGGPEADQGRHGFEVACWPVSKPSGKRWL